MAEGNDRMESRLTALEQRMNRMGTVQERNATLDDMKTMLGDFHDHMAAAMRAGAFMLVTYRSEGGRLYCDVHNHGIVEDDFPNVTKTLQSSLNGLPEVPEQGTPLPRAVPMRPKPMDIMLGKATDTEPEKK